MENNNFFGCYTLSENTLEKLKEVDGVLERNANSASNLWNILRQNVCSENIEPTCIEDSPESTSYRDDEKMDDDKTNAPLPSTQFFFSQADGGSNEPNSTELSNSIWYDIAESLFELSENTSDVSPLTDLNSLSDIDIENVIRYLSEKLSLKGIYNLCRSICNYDTDRNTLYMKTICSHLLLQKIIDMQETSRLMDTLIQELTKKCPDDIQEFIYIPMLNADLRDTSTILAMISSFPLQRKFDLVMNFLTYVHDLKDWHLDVLPQLLTQKFTDNTAKETLLNLLLEKASKYSHDKQYGKLILTFVKLNPPFTESQRNSLCEIVVMNETIYKRIIDNILKNMYFHSDLWHIS